MGNGDRESGHAVTLYAAVGRRRVATDCLLAQAKVVNELWQQIDKQYGVTIDTHTADGVKVGLEHREQNIPLLCLETALPAKFEASIQKALGRAPQRPAGYENIESLPQRCEVMDAGAVKGYIEQEAR